jgi:rhodanese-related sulfurtransferase
MEGFDAAGDRAYAANGERITIEEMRRLWRGIEPVVPIDARSERAWRSEGQKALGALRLPLESPVQGAQHIDLPRQTWLVAYCDCVHDETSLWVVRNLQQAGWSRARALVGGWKAWKAAGLPVERTGDDS